MKPARQSLAPAEGRSTRPALASPPARAPRPGASRPRRPVGRPTKFSRALADELLTSIRAGHYPETACARVGISVETLRTWLRKGARGEGRAYVAFLGALKRAEAEAEHDALELMTAHGQKEWLPLAWRMERRWPQRWARPPQRVEMSGPGGGPIPTDGVIRLKWPWEVAATVSRPTLEPPDIPQLAPSPALQRGVPDKASQT